MYKTRFSTLSLKTGGGGGGGGVNKRTAPNTGRKGLRIYKTRFSTLSLKTGGRGGIYTRPNSWTNSVH